MAFVEDVERLNREISATLERAIASLRRELQDQVRESHQGLDRRIEAFAPAVPAPLLAHEDLAPAAERLRAEARAAGFDELRDAFAALDRARSQSAVLAALIAGAGRFASRAALLLWRGGELRGWGSQGFAAAEKALRDLVLAPPADSVWLKAVRPLRAVDAGEAASAADAAGPVQLSAADCALLCGRIESPVPAFGFLVPLVLRDRIVAVLYADQLQPRREPSEPPETPETPETSAAAAQASPATSGTGTAVSLPALQSLVYVAALAIESLPFRQRDSTTTLASAGQAAAAPAPPAATAALKVEAEAAAAVPETAEIPAAAASAAPPAPAPVPAVTPAALYDSPNVPLVKETAEIRAPKPLRATTPNPARPAAAASNETAITPVGARAESPYMEELAAAPAPLAPLAPESPEAPESDAAPSAPASWPSPPAPQAPPAAPAPGGIETVLLPHAVLREAGAPPAAAPAPFAIREDSAAAVGEPGASQPSAPAPAVAATTGAAAAAGTAAESPSGAADTRGLPGPAPGHGNLRAVPAAPAAPAGPAGIPAVGPTPVPPPPMPPMPQIPPPGPSFEALRTGPIGSGTPEVRPPTGVQGPGWAFSTTRVQATSSEEAVHEEARRLARLLVSEIKLYNEEQVEAGRRNRDIYERLREDIDRSRQMYEERVEPRLVKSTDYFYQELVRILAAGDSKALGI
jgi:hypothetical protein